MAKVAVSNETEALAGALSTSDSSSVFCTTSVRGSEVVISGVVAFVSVGLLLGAFLNKRRSIDIALW